MVKTWCLILQAVQVIQTHSWSRHLQFLKNLLMWENKKNIDNQKTKTKKHIYNIITIAPNYLHEVPDISWIFQVQYYWNNQKNYFFKVTIDRPVLEWMNKMFKDGRSADVSLLRYIQYAQMSAYKLLSAIMSFPWTTKPMIRMIMCIEVLEHTTHQNSPYFSQMYISFELTNERRILKR